MLNEAPLEPLLNVADVQQILGISRAEVYRLVRLGHLTKVDLPIAKTRFTRQAVEDFITGAVAADAP